jgi:hypothetical protein
MPVEISDQTIRPQIAPWFDGRRSRVWLATPFMSFRVAQWLTTVAATGAGDRRLIVAWDKRSLDDLYLSAPAVEALRVKGFHVRHLVALHAKVIIAGSRAYVGSGNLTAFGLDGHNTEIGAFASGHATAPIVSAFERWWARARDIDPATIAVAIRRQSRIAAERARRIDDECQPGHLPPPPPFERPPTVAPDARPAPAARPPAVVHYWRRDTIGLNLGLAGKEHKRFYSRAAMAGKLEPGTRAYTVGWAPTGGLLLLNRFIVTDVKLVKGEWRVAGRDGTPVRFDRSVTGYQYARTVRLRDQRQAPGHYMAFSPLAYLSQRTAGAFDRLIDG